MAIENATQRQAEHHMLGIISEGQSDYITGMEAAGQRQLVNSDRLPTEILHSEQADFEALGFTFGDPDPADPMFRPATLPEGWSRKGSDHAMWSYILDERGIERVGIFYKAAFYDRSAHMSLSKPGYTAASKFIYGEEGEDREPPWDLFTEAERQQFIAGLDSYMADVERHPDIYGKDGRPERVMDKLAALRG